MIIELFGLPATGKTTLAKKIESGSDFKIVKVKNKGELFWYNVLFFLLHPIRFFRGLDYMKKNSPHGSLRRYKVLNLFFDTNAKYQKARRCKKAILDQGYLQNLLSLYEKKVDEKDMRQYARELLLPDKIIVLDVPFNETLRRAAERGYYTRDKFGEEYVQQRQDILRENYQTTLRVLPTLGREIIVITGGEPVSEIISKI